MQEYEYTNRDATFSARKAPTKVSQRRWIRASLYKGVVKSDHFGHMRPVDATTLTPEIRSIIAASPRGFATRNSPCVCGSGVRFKQCCGKSELFPRGDCRRVVRVR